MEEKRTREFQVGVSKDVEPIPSFRRIPPDNTLEALNWSIAKWEFIRDHIDEINSDGGRISCALCSLFHNYGCVGCPVRANTKQKYCHDTPYEQWDHYLKVIEQSKFNRAYMKRMAEAEIRFLASLREYVEENNGIDC